MPNVNSPSGFRPKVHVSGGVIRPSVMPYLIASGLASNIYRGSPVIPVNTSRRINVAAAGNRLLGIFKGVSYVNAAGEVKFDAKWLSGQTLATGTVAEAVVFDDPDILYSAQVSGSAGLVATDVGNFADVVIGTGSAVTNQSGDMLNQASRGTTDGQFKIEALDPEQGNDYGQYAKALCRINETYAGPDATAGNSLTAI
jgi:hypothetical protein